MSKKRSLRFIRDPISNHSTRKVILPFGMACIILLLAGVDRSRPEALCGPVTRNEGAPEMAGVAAVASAGVGAGGVQAYRRAHRGPVWALAVTPDGKLLISAGADKTIKLWSWPWGSLLKTLEGHQGGVGSLAISPDSAFLYSGSMDKTVRIWSLPDGSLRKTLGPFQGRILSLSASPDGRLLAGASADKKLRVWSLPDAAVAETIEESNTVQTVSFSPDGSLLAYNTVRPLIKEIKGRNQIKLLETKTWSLKQALEHKGSFWTKTNDNVFCLLFITPTTLLAGEANGSVWLWSVETGETIGGEAATIFHAGDIPVWALAAVPNGEALASCSEEGIKLFSRSGKRRFVMAQPFPSLALAFPDPGTVVSGDNMGHILLWSVSQQSAQGSLEDPGLGRK